MKSHKKFIIIFLFTILISPSFKNVSAQKDNLKLNFFYSDKTNIASKENRPKIITTSESGKLLKTTYIKNFSLDDNIVYFNTNNTFNGKVYFYGHENTKNKPGVIEVDEKSLKSKIYNISIDKNFDYTFDDIYIEKDNIFVLCKYTDDNKSILIKINKSTKKVSYLDLDISYSGLNNYLRTTDNKIFIATFNNFIKINKKNMKIEKEFNLDNYFLDDTSYLSNFKKLDSKWYIAEYGDIYSYDSKKDILKLEKFSKEKTEKFSLELIGIHHKNATFLFNYPISKYPLLYKLDNSEKIIGSNLDINKLGNNLVKFKGDVVINFNGYLDFYSVKNVLNKRLAPIKTIKLSEDIVGDNLVIHFSVN